MNQLKIKSFFMLALLLLFVALPLSSCGHEHVVFDEDQIKNIQGSYTSAQVFSCIHNGADTPQSTLELKEDGTFVANDSLLFSSVTYASIGGKDIISIDRYFGDVRGTYTPLLFMGSDTWSIDMRIVEPENIHLKGININVSASGNKRPPSSLNMQWHSTYPICPLSDNRIIERVYNRN